MKDPIQTAIDAMQVLIDDQVSEINNRYQTVDGEFLHPSYERKFNRDMEDVEKAKQALSQLRAMQETDLEALDLEALSIDYFYQAFGKGKTPDIPSAMNRDEVNGWNKCVQYLASCKEVAQGRLSPRLEKVEGVFISFDELPDNIRYEWITDSETSNEELADIVVRKLEALSGGNNER